mgnify:CR=1 FL=1
MFVEFKTTDSGNNTGNGLRTWVQMLDYVMTNNTTSLNNAISYGLEYYTVWSDQNPGDWVRRETNGSFNTSSSIPGHHWAWSQPVIGKSTQPFFHKGFAVQWTRGGGANGNNYFQGYMGAFQDPSSRDNFASFDFGRPLNWAYTNEYTTARTWSTLNSNNRYVYQDRYIMAAAEGYVFIGNVDQGTFWSVVDGTTLPIHQFTTSSAIPMLGITGAGNQGNTDLTRHDLRVHVHKYDSGSGTAYNQLSSFSQQINGDSTAAPNTQNFLNLYPSSVSNQGFLNRYDEDGKKSTALYPIIIGNPIRGNAYQTTEGILLLSGQNHETSQTFYVGPARYYKFVSSHDRTNRAPEFSGLTIGVPVR